MKSVMLSIQPKWVEKIVKGEKTIEVRKTRPKIKTPFKCYIYCTYGQKNENYMLGKRGKVIGEFVCDKVYLIKNQGSRFSVADEEQSVTNEIARQSCLDYDDMVSYLGNKDGYGLHITDLKIYVKPKELSEFNRITDKCVFNKDGVCQNRKQNQVILCKNLDCDCKKIVRPPQSWYYMEGIINET